ncbi:hypothetical protein [Mesorhizobium sp. M0239]|uniref:hypothetical protein n=1 Tax=Mesorhizobium sp. M0239 TaxID=2956924 RepID=UPI00333D6849
MRLRVNSIKMTGVTPKQSVGLAAFVSQQSTHRLVVRVVHCIRGAWSADKPITLRGRELIRLVFQKHHSLPVQISREALWRSLVIETYARRNEVLKFLVALKVAEAGPLSVVSYSIGAIQEAWRKPRRSGSRPQLDV